MRPHASDVSAMTAATVSGMAADDKPALLVSDAERERGSRFLRDAVVDGRLTLEEFTNRVGSAQVVRTEPELATLLADLPAQAREAAVQVTASHRALFSRLVRQGLWELPQRSRFSSIFGTITLDLRSATLTGDEVEVEVYNLFGTVTLIVPEGIRVSVEGGGMFASQVIQTPARSRCPARRSCGSTSAARAARCM